MRSSDARDADRGDHEMNTITLHAQITGLARTTANPETNTAAADAALWRSAALLLRERTYTSESRDVRVRIDWKPLVDRDEDDDSIALEMQLSDGREQPDVRDASSFVDLFFHDVFLILNLAVPGSFGGVIATLAEGEYRGSEVSLSARAFEYAWATSTRNGWPRIEPLPLADVIVWYDALRLGTSQVATEDVAKALFVLLHLARREEDETMSVLRLGQALEALLGESARSPKLTQFFALRDSIAHGSGPVLHPMADDALDATADDASFELVEASDFAGSVLVSAIQERVERRRDAGVPF
jgi:hypothetical protein